MANGVAIAKAQNVVESETKIICQSSPSPLINKCKAESKLSTAHLVQVSCAAGFTSMAERLGFHVAMIADAGLAQTGYTNKNQPD